MITNFTHINLVNIGTITNVTGDTAMIGYVCVALFLTLSLIVVVINIKKLDRRYYPILFIVPVIGLFGIATYYFKGIIIYDVVLVLLCYIMYFTIENPDLKLLSALEISKKEAEKFSQAKTDFLSSMSHEIRTPLNAIVNFNMLIKDSTSLEETKTYSKEVIEASNILLDTINGILDISKIESGKYELTNTSYESKEAFESVFNLIEPRAKEKNLNITMNISKDIPKVLYGDATNLKKCILNILTNAVKYTDKGSINYDVKCVKNNNEVKLIITVEDTGRGIKKEDVNKLFTKFQRLEEDKNSNIEGTGLGLAITKQTLDLMKGKISVNSEFGKGSKFVIVVNQMISNKILGEEKVSENKTDFKNKSVLIVDDNMLNIKVTDVLLKKYNISVYSCLSGQECIDFLKNNNKIDLILLDDMMPKLSGVETLKILKKDKNFNMPTVALTANALAGMREKYLENGFDEYLAKPMSKPELEKVLSKYL